MATGDIYLVNFGFTAPDWDDGFAVMRVHVGDRAIGLWAVEGLYDPTTFELDQSTVQSGLVSWELTPGEGDRFNLYYKVPNLGDPTLYVRGHIVGRES